MSNTGKTGLLEFRDADGKWYGTYGGKLLLKSFNRNYVVDMVAEGKCNRANAMGVTSVVEADELVDRFQGNDDNLPAPNEDGHPDPNKTFTIGERFEYLADFVDMVSSYTSPSVTICGDGGLGKTYTVKKALMDAGLEDITRDLLGKIVVPLEGQDEEDVVDVRGRSVEEQKQTFIVVKGYSTAKALFRTLYENRNRIIVFDDCDSIQKNLDAINILKAALDSYDERIVTWNSESFGDDLPKSFEFCGGVIFISNMKLNRIDQAIRSRSICVDVSMTTDQKIERMGHIAESDEFLPQYDIEHKRAALKFIADNKDVANELSLRTLITVTKVASRGGKWERRAMYLLQTM